MEVLEGDVTQMHLGLSGTDYKRVLRSAGEIWHLAGIADLSADARRLRAVNVEGTRNVLDLARACTRLSRLHHFSTASVSGDREGVILEDGTPQHFFENPTHDRTKLFLSKILR